ncbi:MAG: tRNA (adenosine(37)-N6)-threonylcarbamoyltransferase complex ATPase subunit type 1 TsaE, partial [Ilumatobacteraceae bacterium]
MLLLRSSALADTQAIAAQVALLSRPGDIIVLSGEMGAGKTAFAQGFGRALGVDEPITSPTFTLVQSYETSKGQLHHADVYRLEQLH